MLVKIIKNRQMDTFKCSKLILLQREAEPMRSERSGVVDSLVVALSLGPYVQDSPWPSLSVQCRRQSAARIKRNFTFADTDIRF